MFDEKKAYAWIKRMKAKDPLWEKKQEFGRFCFRHINDLSVNERKRYDILKKELMDAEKIIDNT